MAMNLSALQKPYLGNLNPTSSVEIVRAKVENAKKAWQSFQDSELKLDSLPFKIIFELTQNCNFRCDMCPQSYDEKFKRYRPEYNLSLENFTQIADQLFPTATFVDLRGFGESTILPHWNDVVDYLERFPFIDWHLVTNLSLPRDAVWEKMMRLGFILGFSCDGASAEVFETIRKRSHFDKICHNLGVVRDAIERHQNGSIYFISTIQKRNIHEMAKIVELAHRYSVTEVQFKVVKPDDSPFRFSDMDEREIKKYVDEALDSSLALGMKTNFNDWIFTKNIDPLKVKRADQLSRRPLPTRAKEISESFYRYHPEYAELCGLIHESTRVSVAQKCFKPYSFTYINYEGKMGTCNHMMYPEMLEMGDLSKESVVSAWNSLKYQAFRYQLVKAKPKDRRCKWCFEHRIED